MKRQNTAKTAAVNDLIPFLPHESKRSDRCILAWGLRTQGSESRGDPEEPVDHSKNAGFFRVKNCTLRLSFLLSLSTGSVLPGLYSAVGENSSNLNAEQHPRYSTPFFNLLQCPELQQV